MDTTTTLVLSVLIGAIALVGAYFLLLRRPGSVRKPVSSSEHEHGKKKDAQKNKGQHSSKKAKPTGAKALPDPDCLILKLQERRTMINSLSWHPSENALALALSDRKLKLWFFEAAEPGKKKTTSSASSSAQQRAKGTDTKRPAYRAFGTRHQQEVQVPFDVANTVDFTPDGKFLVCSLEKKKEIAVFRVRLHKTRDGKASEHVRTLSPPVINHKSVICAGVAPAYGSNDGGLLLWTCTDDTMAYLQDKNGTLLESINSNQMENYCGACSPCGRFFGIGSFQPDVRLWSLRFAPNGKYTSLTKVNSMAGHKSGVLSLAFSPDSKTAATSSKDGTVRIWRMELVSELDRPETILTIEAKSAGVASFRHVSFSKHAGVLLAISGSRMCFFSTRDGKLLGSLDYHQSPILDLSWSPQGRFLATTTYNTVCIWDVKRLITKSESPRVHA